MASNLPPGVTQRMIDDHLSADRPCEVCGYFPDDCVCPVCPECGKQGNPNCYGLRGIGAHNLERTLAQDIGKAKLQVAELESQAAEARVYLEYLTGKEKEEGGGK
jgi:hypothetical protein